MSKSKPKSKVAAESQKRTIYIDMLKITAVFAVIVMHVSNMYVDRIEEGFSAWMGLNLFVIASLFCVPVFVMCSGALLLRSDKIMPIDAFYKKRLPKIIIPLLAWCFIYYLYGCHTGDFHFNVGTFLKKTLSGKIAPHFWYLHMMIGVYLSAPYIHLAIKNGGEKYLYFIMIFCFVINSVNPLLEQFFRFEFRIQFSMFTAYIGYFCLGYYLSKTDFDPVKTRIVSLITYMTSILFTAYGTFYLIYYKWTYKEMLMDYQSPTIVLMAVSVFLFLKSFAYEGLKPATQKGLAQVGNATYGIYLVHLLIIFVLRRGELGFTLAPNWISVPVGATVSALTAFALSLAIVLVLLRIPWLRKIVS